jgi:hypothetical protein
MKIIAENYISPVLTEGIFNNVFIEEISIQLKRKDTYLRIDFEMYVEKNNQKVILDSNCIAFQGMNIDENNTNRKATFRFDNDPEEQEPRGLIQYVIDNGFYPTDYYMVDWGYASYEDALTYLLGGSFQEPELQPANDFVKSWILNTLIMKNEFLVKQFEFVI